MTSEVLRWMTSFGAAGVLLAVVNGLFGKRKLSAEATKIITDAASGTLKDVRDENVRLLGRTATLEARVDAVERENRKQSEHLRQTDALIVIHGEWDRQAFYAAKSSGIQLPEPPPLTIGG
jgi:hypothetical protein